MGSSPPDPPARRRRGRGRRGRKRQDGQAQADSTPPADSPEPAVAEVDWTPLMENEDSRAQLRQRLLAAANRLSPELRAAWMLVDSSGQTLEESAAALELNPATLASRLHRARLALRLELSRARPASPGETS